MPGYNKCIHYRSYRELYEYKTGLDHAHLLHPRDNENRCFVLKSTFKAHLSSHASCPLVAT